MRVSESLPRSWSKTPSRRLDDRKSVWALPLHWARSLEHQCACIVSLDDQRTRCPLTRLGAGHGRLVVLRTTNRLSAAGDMKRTKFSPVLARDEDAGGAPRR